jgi:hypothetical protein
MRGKVCASLALCAAFAEGQASPGSILNIDLTNATMYFRGYCTGTDQGQSPSKLTRAYVMPFTTGLGIADIVAVNGQPVKGTAIEIIRAGNITSTFTPGKIIGDITSSPAASSWNLTFLNPDATVIGTILIDGNAGGSPPPGAPKAITGTSYTIVGGSGAFFGARGYFQPTQDTVSPERQTTDCEDPAYRHINADPGGNKRHPVLYLVPLVQPQIVSSSGVPAVYHSDFTPVTAAKPATTGEVLISMATGMGPTQPGVDPGQPFPVSPFSQINSPVGVAVSQQSAEVINAIGWPGLVDTYRVDFRIPSGTAAGQVAIQLSSAWITGPAVSIPVQ